MGEIYLKVEGLCLSSLFDTIYIYHGIFDINLRVVNLVLDYRYEYFHGTLDLQFTKNMSAKGRLLRQAQ